jgi:DNA-directed RNA polymerase subunit RPC12/RpoP
MNENEKFAIYKKRLRGLKNFKNLSDIEFDVIAQKKWEAKNSEQQEEKKSGEIISTEQIENEVGIWISPEEAKEALDLFNKYVKSRNYSEASDIALLKNLIFYEMQLKRIYIAINEEYKNVKAQGKTADVPSHELKTINEINEQVIELKKILGLAEENKGADPFIYIDMLKKKFKVWLANNQGSRTLVCPHCSKMIMLKIRTEAWETLKHPFFKDKILCNEHAWELYKNKTITSLDLAKILLGKDCKSDLFIHWLEKKIYSVQENKDPLKESGQD